MRPNLSVMIVAMLCIGCARTSLPGSDFEVVRKSVVTPGSELWLESKCELESAHPRVLQLESPPAGTYQCYVIARSTDSPVFSVRIVDKSDGAVLLSYESRGDGGSMSDPFDLSDEHDYTISVTLNQQSAANAHAIIRLSRVRTL